MLPSPPSSTLFPYTTLFRSEDVAVHQRGPLVGFVENAGEHAGTAHTRFRDPPPHVVAERRRMSAAGNHQLGLRSEEHTSELQSRRDLVCRLLLEKKKKNIHS